MYMNIMQAWIFKSKVWNICTSLWSIFIYEYMNYERIWTDKMRSLHFEAVIGSFLMKAIKQDKMWVPSLGDSYLGPFLWRQLKLWNLSTLQTIGQMRSLQFRDMWIPLWVSTVWRRSQVELTPISVYPKAVKLLSFILLCWWLDSFSTY